MNIRDIHFLLKVCECESINLAAEQLYITPQGLSNIMNRIEKEIGAELFVRSPSGTYPTDYGKAFMKHAEKIIDHYEDALQEIREIRSRKEGTVRLGYAFGALSYRDTDFPLRFQERFQDYRLEFTELPDAMVEDFVERGEADIGFTACPDMDRFDAELMYEAHILFVAHDQSRFYDMNQVSVAEIYTEPLTLRDEKFATTRILMKEFSDRGSTPSVLLRTGGIVRSMVLCTERKANTVILDFLADDFKYNNIRVIPFEEDLRWPLYMITRKGRELSPAARVFVEHLRKS